MPTYLYGLVLSRNAARVPPNVAAIGRAPVRVVACGDLSAIASTLDDAPSPRDLESVAAHDRAMFTVVREGVTAVASRFGQLFASDTTLCDELAASSTRLRAMLERYDGSAEMRVSVRDVVESHVTAPASITSSAVSPGRAYLESVRARLNERPPLTLRGHLGDLILDERAERRKDVQTLSHRIRFEDEGRYRAVLATHPALAGAAITGPHPLYTFAEAG